MIVPLPVTPFGLTRVCSTRPANRRPGRPVQPRWTTNARSGGSIAINRKTRRRSMARSFSVRWSAQDGAEPAVTRGPRPADVADLADCDRPWLTDVAGGSVHD